MMFLNAIKRQPLEKKYLPMLIIWLYAAMLIWYRMAAGSLPLIVAVWLLTLLITSFFIGDLFLKYALHDIKKFNNLPTKLLSGLLCVNFLLFMACFTLPFDLTTDWCTLFTCITILWYRARRKSFNISFPPTHLSEVILIFVVPLSITIWCHELLQPIKIQNAQAIIPAWKDVYFHLSQISTIAFSNGSSSISDVQMANSVVHPYHLASYMLPSVLVKIIGGNSLVAYASILVPLGIFMTCLAAYSLSNSLFGKWPALASSLALILLPDAYQQGFGNAYLAYHWLEQITPAQGYGIASAAFAFMLILEACRTTQYRFVFLGYVFVLITLLYKAHIFVAISFPALIYPVLFMKGRISRYRIFLTFLLTSLYIGIVGLSQTSSIIPTLKLDGSGVATYSSVLLAYQESGLIKNIFLFFFTKTIHHEHLKRLAFACMVLLCTFGGFSILYCFLFKCLKRSILPAIKFFPLIVMAVYLIMAVGLALDTHHLGTPDELLHRPFVWAWFVFVVWCTGAVYFCLYNDKLPPNPITKYSLLLIIFTLEIIPLHYSQGIQTAIGYSGVQKVPQCVFKAAEFVRTHSLPNEVIQDSQNDSELILSSLAERRPFAIDSGGVRPPVGINKHLAWLRELKKLTDSKEVELFMKQHQITWYIAHPKDNIPWEKNTLNRLVFKCGGYRVYCFS